MVNNHRIYTSMKRIECPDPETEPHIFTQRMLPRQRERKIFQTKEMKKIGNL